MSHSARSEGGRSADKGPRSSTITSACERGRSILVPLGADRDHIAEQRRRRARGADRSPHRTPGRRDRRADLLRLPRAHGSGGLPGGVRSRQPAERRAGLPARRDRRARAAAHADGSLPGRQLRVELRLARRCRAPRSAAPAPRLRVAVDRDEPVRHRRVHGLVPGARDRTDDGGQPGHGRRQGSGGAPRVLQPADRHEHRRRARRQRPPRAVRREDCGAWATRWTRPGRPGTSPPRPTPSGPAPRGPS